MDVFSWASSTFSKAKKLARDGSLFISTIEGSSIMGRVWMLNQEINSIKLILKSFLEMMLYHI